MQGPTAWSSRRKPTWPSRPSGSNPTTAPAPSPSLSNSIPQLLRAIPSRFGPTLALPVQLRAESSMRPVLVVGTLCWPSELSGLPVPAQPILRNPVELRIPLSDEQLARLEAHRAGHELALELRLRGLAQFNTSTIPVSSGHNPTTILIPRDRWLAVLDQCGFGKRRLIELPPPPPAPDDAWGAVTGQL
ncbi:MAG: hypothetical protein ACREQ5_21620, partial [Candidatus Dormibacteria bacterium]